MLPYCKKATWIGLRKTHYTLPPFFNMPIAPTKMSFTEQVFIADSITMGESVSKLEESLIGVGKMLNEALSRAETVIITNT